MGFSSKTPEDKARNREIGRKGGLATKKKKLKENPNYYSEIGLAGGQKLLALKGKEWYGKIGSMPSKKKNKPQVEGEVISNG